MPTPDPSAVPTVVYLGGFAADGFFLLFLAGMGFAVCAMLLAIVAVTTGLRR